MDGAGNVYFADDATNAVKEWNIATQLVITLVSSGLNGPDDVAVDGSGNVYISDNGHNAIKEWNAATQTVSTLVSMGLHLPYSVAVDAVGNVYIADAGDNAIKEWNAATQTVSTLVSSGLNYPTGVAVDASGNVYITDYGHNAVKEWNAATQSLITLVSGQNSPFGAAVDGVGNVFFADSGNEAVKERPRAFVSTTAFNEGAAAGGDALLPVLPTSESLIGIFAPSCDQSWPTIGGISSDVVNFSFTQNTTNASRTAHITLLGQQITVTQARRWPQTYSLKARRRATIPTRSALRVLGRQAPMRPGCTRRPAATATVSRRSPSMPTRDPSAPRR